MAHSREDISYQRDAEGWACRTEGEIVRDRYIERETADRIRFAAALERLRAGNAQLKSKDTDGLSLKVNENGAVSLYGVGRFPVTLYEEQ